MGKDGKTTSTRLYAKGTILGFKRYVAKVSTHG